MNVTHLHNNSIPYLEISNSSKIFEIFNTKRKSNNIPERFKKRFSIISNPHMTVSKSEESYAETEDKLKGNLNDSSKRSNDDITITDKSEEVDESGGESSKKFKTGRWTEEEHKKFMEAIMIYGNDWKKVQKVLMTRSSIQARSHAQKFFLRVRKYLNLLKKECSNGELFSEIKKGITFLYILQS